MIRTRILLVLFSLLLASPSGGEPVEVIRPFDEAGRPRAAAVRGPVGEVGLAFYDFEAPGGGPDPQGWQSVDVLETTVNHWHVDESTGLGPEYQSMFPSRALWCGVRPEDVPVGWGTAPGYGNDWNEVIASQTFLVTGDVNLFYSVGFDLEDGYDFLYLEAQIGAGAPWQTVQIYTGESDPFPDFVFVAAGLVDTEVTLRFRLDSDFSTSDEGGAYDSRGAAVLDDILVTGSQIGDLSFEDFEDESLGAQTTADGFWSITNYSSSTLGNRGALVNGSGVLQEDPGGPNLSHFWSFYENSPDTYRCGEEPTQPAVPLCTDPSDPNFNNSLANDLQSPWIQLDNGTPGFEDLTQVGFGFHIYLDNPSDEYVFHYPLVRWRIDGVDQQEWTSDSFVYYGTSRLWWYRTFRYEIPEGATHVQFGIRVADLGYAFNPDAVPGVCHSHAPLIDDVVIVLLPEDPILVTNGADSGPGTLREAIETANADPRPSRIHFNLPGPSYRVDVYNSLPDLTAPVVIDGTTQPGYAGTPLVRIDEVAPVLRGAGGLDITDDSVIRGISVTGFDFGTGIRVRGSRNLIEHCWIGVLPGGSGTNGNGDGISLISGASDNRIGSDVPGLENVFAGNFQDIVLTNSAGERNDLRGNVFRPGTGAAIDLGPYGSTANDDLDADTGPNGLQNHPEIVEVDGQRGLIRGVLSSAPDTQYQIDLYECDGCEPGGISGGDVLLATLNLTTDVNGRVDFEMDLGDPLASGLVISAIATDPDGNTSEFGRGFAVPEVITVVNTNDSGAGSLRDAIDLVNGGGFDGAPRIEFAIPGTGPHRIVLDSALPW
ncbi:MAG: hypothetical protein KJO06_10895, partial [Gemmatimonadetes bacterium]|nr:hypothetical protein [Gemmatimonadota bacterium]